MDTVHFAKPPLKLFAGKLLAGKTLARTWNMAVGSGQSSIPVPPTTALRELLSWMLLTARWIATRLLEQAVSTLEHKP
jgi:hypothetical protein